MPPETIPRGIPPLATMPKYTSAPLSPRRDCEREICCASATVPEAKLQPNTLPIAHHNVSLPKTGKQSTEQNGDIYGKRQIQAHDVA
jgi:hypothetical protein